MMKKLVFASLILFFTATASASFYSVDEVKFSTNLPSEHDAGELISIEGEAEGYNLEEISIYEERSGVDAEIDNRHCGGTQRCSIEFEGSFEEGERTFYIWARAEGSSGSSTSDDSERQTVTFTQPEERDTGINWIETPPEDAETSTEYNFEVEAVDSFGELAGQEFELRYTQVGDGEFSLLGSTTCSSSENEVCTLEISDQSFDDAGEYEFDAFVETSDGETISDFISINFEDPELENPSIELLEPEDGSENIGLSPAFSWEAEDPEDRDLEFTLYLDEGENGDDPWDGESFETDEESLELDEQLETSTSYVWGVEVEAGESSVQSEVFEFTTRDEDLATLKVNVRDSNYNSLKDADVRVENSETEEKKTDSSGRAEFNLNPDSYHVTASKSGYSSDSKEITLSEGETESIDLTLQKHEENEPPVPNLHVRPSTQEVGKTVTFDASDSYDPDGRITRYRFDFNNDGTWDRSTSRSSVERSFSTAGSRTARVEVRDNEGATRTTTASYRITDERDERDPVARLDIRPDPAITGETVTFDASGSYGGDSRIREYRFDFENDGRWDRVTTSSSVERSFSTAGHREARIQVRDLNGNTDTVRRGYSIEERRPSEKEADLDVTVRDTDGSRLRDARVHASNGDSKTRYTDRNGRASFTLQPDRYQVTASKSGYRSDSTSIRLRDGDSRSVTLRLEGRDDTDTDTDISIRNMDYPSSVCKGESMRVSFDAENNRATSESMKVSGSGLGSISLGQRISVGSGETKSTSLLFTNVQGQGEEQFTVKLTNGNLAEETRTIKVEDCQPDRDPGRASGITMNLNPQSTTIGNAVRVSGYVDGVRGRKDVRINVDGRQAARVNTQPDGYYETFIRPNQVGDLTVTASTDSVRQSRTLEVRPTVDVFYANVDGPVFEGESFDVCSDVESQVTPKVILSKDGERIDSKNERGEVCFERTELESGEYEYEIEALARGSSSSASTSVNVMETDLETRNFPDQVAQVRSGPSIIRVELYNTEQNLKRYDLELSGLPRDWTDQSDKQVVVRPGERKEAFFYLTPKADGVRTADLKISHDSSVIHDQEIEVRTGGTTKPGKNWLERFLTRLGR